MSKAPATAREFEPVMSDAKSLFRSRKLLISPFQSDLLNLSRWLAAFLVVAEHLRSFVFRPYGADPHSGVLGKAFYFVTDFGHAAVMVFFVMSGFLVGGKVLEQVAAGSFSWQKYVVDRTSRLYAVYLLALFLGGALDYLGYHYLNRFGVYDRSYFGNLASVNTDFHANLTPPVLGVNLVMCQTILGPVFGSNGPLWSLANEFWYYLAGPILFLLFYAKSAYRFLLCIVALASIFWFLPAHILIYFLVWLMGALLYYINSRPLLPASVSLLLFLGCFSIARLQWINVPYVADFLIGISFAFLVNSSAGNFRRIPGHVLSREAADFSYSVYLCHFPFLVFILSALYEMAGIGFRASLSASFLMLSLTVLVLAYIWCYLISLITERQTPRIRSFFNRFIAFKAELPAAKTL
jgi:peptidoglycan/LPS O-acetylase OafA/YrhL